jgi:hypothetical protein
MVRYRFHAITVPLGSAASCDWKKHGVFENIQSITYGYINISIFILGAVVNKSEATTVVYCVFETWPSQTHGNINMSICILGAVVKKSEATTVIYSVFGTWPSKTQSKTNISTSQMPPRRLLPPSCLPDAPEMPQRCPGASKMPPRWL